MQKYGFIYIWRDRKHKRYYIGSHWGTEDDGYVCSSKWMQRSYKRRPEDFSRRILTIVQNRNLLLEEEHRWLAKLPDDRLGNRYYNLTKHQNGHWASDEQKRIEVLEKLASPLRYQKISEALRGRKRTEEQKEHQRALMTGRKHSLEHKTNISLGNLGRVVTEETREKIRQRHLGKTRAPMSEEHKRIIGRASKEMVPVVDQFGLTSRINKQQYADQKIGPSEMWKYVSTASNEAKIRKTLKEY